MSRPRWLSFPGSVTWFDVTSPILEASVNPMTRSTTQAAITHHRRLITQRACRSSMRSLLPRLFLLRPHRPAHERLDGLHVAVDVGLGVQAPLADQALIDPDRDPSRGVGFTPLTSVAM